MIKEIKLPCFSLKSIKTPSFSNLKSLKPPAPIRVDPDVHLVQTPLSPASPSSTSSNTSSGSNTQEEIKRVDQEIWQPSNAQHQACVYRALGEGMEPSAKGQILFGIYEDLEDLQTSSEIKLTVQEIIRIGKKMVDSTHQSISIRKIPLDNGKHFDYRSEEIHLAKQPGK
ncbi:uncharacterized protein I303_106082 [Kwoniella dejecticola CBS 10117]|uniref:Uncharacterized protein n=1 Tax=Kwoniella dejecticola CBS 10117 TaxID=1296121 RepID=A0AAJ8KSF7_9TREE